MLINKILVVEDDPLIASLCKDILRAHRFDPIVATHGSAGLATYNERHQEICLILSDVSMPGMGGIEMVRSIFQLHSRANVIMMSGHNLSDLIPDEVRRLCSVIEKPFTPSCLIAAVNKCLDYEKVHHSGAS